MLLDRAGLVLAIEKDARLVVILQERFDGVESRQPKQARGQLQLISDDALDYLRREPRDWAGWKMVANLPYAVASPIIVELAQANSGPDRIVTTLQLEVARRLMANADDADYGVLTLLVQLRYEPLEWFKIPAGCFFPQPEVDSACIVLMRRTEMSLDLEEQATFSRVVKCSFSQRRKKMMKLLRQNWPTPTVEQAFREIGLDPDTRAEKVNLEQFVALSRRLHERRNL
jgi:16S rRNA (adenine1518-N6/adenine1519-N6)-dimethyltransferase